MGKTAAVAAPGAQIVGHAQVRDVLGRAVAEGRSAQAYVFSGPEGVGKRAVGLWFARMLLCRARCGNEPCNACVACRKILEESHPDVVEISLESTVTFTDNVVKPTGKARARGGQGVEWSVRRDQSEKKQSIGVVAARRMQTEAGFAPIEGAWKIFLLTEAHRFTDQAMNGLLKLLEEPQAQRIFVLMTPSHGALLPTILSRCQLIRFASLESAEVAAWLRGLGVEADRAALAAGLSEGRPGMALRMVADTKLWDFRQKVLSAASSFTRAEVYALMDTVEKLSDLGGSEKRQAVERTLEMLTMWFRDVVWLQRGLDPGRILNGDHVDALHEAASVYTFEQSMHALGALREAREQVTHNVNARLMYTRLLLHLRPR